MTDTGTHVVVDAGEKGLDDLLQIVRTQGRTVRICVAGKPVADLRPSIETVDPLQTHTELQGEQLDPNAFAPASDEEWPLEAR